MQMLKIAVVYGSVRETRLGIKAARYITKRITERGHDAVLIDPMEYNLPLINKRYFEDPDNSVLQKLHDIFLSSDAFVIVTAEYNHSLPPALTNLLDHFYEEFHYKPSGIVCYSNGQFGGVRAMIQARAFLAEIGMSSIMRVLSIPFIQDAFDSQNNPKDERLSKNADKFLTDLEWYAQALKLAREKGMPKK